MVELNVFFLQLAKANGNGFCFRTSATIAVWLYPTDMNAMDFVAEFFDTLSLTLAIGTEEQQPISYKQK